MDDLDEFLRYTYTPPLERGLMRQVMDALVMDAQANYAGAEIRSACGDAARYLRDKGLGGIVLARLGEPAVIIVRDDMRRGEATWHAARLMLRLGGSPLTLEPEQAGVIESMNIPRRRWAAEHVHESVTDVRTSRMLALMGVPKWFANRYRRPRTRAPYQPEVVAGWQSADVTF